MPVARGGPGLDENDNGVAREWRLPDELWERSEPLLPKRRRHPQGGRPCVGQRQSVDGIFYVLQTGCQWQAVPREFGSGSTRQRRFQQWVQRGVFRRLWQAGLLEYDALQGIQWEWPARDGALPKAPLGGEKCGKNPPERAQSGTKRALLTAGAGVPRALAVDGANRQDKQLVGRTLNNLAAARPAGRKQNMCTDKGYDYPAVRELVAKWGYTAHSVARGAERRAGQRVPGYRVRRWVVQRTHSWFNRFRRLLIRWEQKVANYTALLHLACAHITLRTAEVMG